MSTTTGNGNGDCPTKFLEARKRLIGNDQYILTRKGNKLVRDVRKLKHILASEKVRWSLHTTRLKLAKKQQYCQFFTRFGKCNKENGKCAYIHDPNKIAVCTKFLKGLCSGYNCKLTHKCRKKHTYVCPHLEEKGVCPVGRHCKLYHPKKRSKCRKRQSAEEQRNRRGRYYCCLNLINDGGFRSPVSASQTVEAGVQDFSFCDRQYADYISLDIGKEEAETVDEPIDRYAILAERESSDTQTDNLDDLIRPVLLLR